jgi:hypothetical protein
MVLRPWPITMARRGSCQADCENNR